MHIAQLMLTNWKCYRGNQRLDLGPQTYAVVARARDDAERSNWLGKSSVFEAVHFALYGEHTSPTEDAWISRGEKQGGVDIVFSDGSRISRSRTLGKSTRLFYFPPNVADEKKAATQDEAQKLIIEAMGLDDRDFLATCYFQQKALARFVTTEASKRMEMVSSWLRLEPLQRCEDEARERVSVTAEQLGKLKAAADVHRATLQRLTVEGGATQLVATAEQLEHATTVTKEALDRVLEEMRVNEAIIASADMRRQYDDTVARGKDAAARVAVTSAELAKHDVAARQSELERVAGERAIALRRLEQATSTARGEFDGKCPVAPIECPARATIAGLTAENRKALEDARAVADEVSKTYASIGQASREANNAREEHMRAEERLRALRERVRTLMQSVKDAPAGVPTERDAIRSRYEQARRVHDEAIGTAIAARAAVDLHRTSTEALAQIDAEILKTEAAIGTAREALAIFGKNGAQRRLAEGALGEIEANANKLLRVCGIDLDVAVRWGREGSGLAKTCDSCGAPFPTSTKVKACARCGADRGPLIVNKLDVVLSNRSGAAEDLAGAAIQLSASEWLRRERTSRWGVSLIDEPFAACDKANRRRLAVHLQAMLRGEFGFEQSFVISHTPDTVEMLSGRIEVESNNGWSTIRVAS